MLALEKLPEISSHHRELILNRCRDCKLVTRVALFDKLGIGFFDFYLPILCDAFHWQAQSPRRATAYIVFYFLSYYQTIPYLDKSLLCLNYLATGCLLKFIRDCPFRPASSLLASRESHRALLASPRTPDPPKFFAQSGILSCLSI